MPGDEGLGYLDTSHEMDAISRYTAFLALQAEAHALTDKEYLDRLDAITREGGVPEGWDHYPDGDEADGISQAVIEAIQSDDDPPGSQGSKRVLQFEQYGGTIDQQLGNAPPASGPPDAPEGAGSEDPEAESGDPTLQIDFEGDDGSIAADGTAITAGGRYGDASQPESADPAPDANYGDGGQVLAADGTAIDGPSEPEATDADDPYHAGVYKHIESEPEASEEEKEDDDVPAASGFQPEDGRPRTVGATLLADDEEELAYGGGLYVSEHFEVNDWLDAVGAGTGLLQGVQTAEYIPPGTSGPPQNGLVKTPLMQKLDRKVEYTYGPEGGQPQPGLDGPNV